ncbi:MAG: pseudouridine synthase [Saprospiraceae bacterium]
MKNPSKKFEKKPVPQKVLLKDGAEDIRLNKYVAQCGIASRRAADDLIKNGKVWVNGNVVMEPGARIKTSDRVTYQGKLLKPELNLIYLLMNKPKDTITTLNDEKGRKTVMDLVEKKITERVYPIGRLDRMTTGLLLITNDGELAKTLSHPSSEVRKVYAVVLDKNISIQDLEKIAQGLDLEDGKAVIDGISYIDGMNANEVGITLHSGKNRIVRRIFEHLGYDVVKLDRVSYAGLNKKDLPRGHFRHLTEKEITLLKHFGNRKKNAPKPDLALPKKSRQEKINNLEKPTNSKPGGFKMKNKIDSKPKSKLTSGKKTRPAK